MYPNRYALVCGYGCCLTDSLKKYLGRVIVWAKRNPDVTLVLSGGFTNKKTAPGVSEASLMRDFLKRWGVKNSIILDEDAVLSIDNIRNFAKIIKGTEKNRKVFVFCDSTRATKVWVLSLIYIGFFTLILHDFKRSTKEKITQPIKSFLEILFPLIPPMEDIVRKQRLKLNENR